MLISLLILAAAAFFGLVLLALGGVFVYRMFNK